MRAQILARLLERAGLVMISLVLLSGTFVAMSGKASATPASPPHDWSFYVRYPYSGIYPGSYVDGSSNAYTLGCNQGKYDSSHGDINSETFLDFGRQNGTGSISVFTGFSFSQAMIERYSENFAAGYWECTGADSSSILYLGIGTNTSVPSVVTTSAGATWAGTVNSVSNYNESDHASQQVVIRGANDIEPAWVSQASAINWVNGYQNAGGPLYEDFGSCDGCPTIATTGNGYPFGPCSGCSNWNQYGAWYVSWGASDALIIPEIYYYNQQGGWAGLSYYSVLAHGGRIYFDGPMDEYDMPNAGGSYTQASSWSVFWNVLQGFGGAIAMTPKFALEQHQTNS